jgi:nucleotide-binding universal stress UspA family protein
MMTTKSEAQGSMDEAQREALLELALKPVRHILVPLDLSHGSLSTIRQAIRLGQHFGSRITLLHVYQQPIAFEISRATRLNTELLKDQRQTEESLKEQGTLLRAAYPNCEWILRSGAAGTTILEVALELRADLIVISSHHHGWADRFSQGDNADHILHHALCPVLEVRDDGKPFLTSPDIIALHP